MNPELQQRIAAIKAECEEIIHRSKLATQGQWHVEKGRDHVWVGNKSTGSVGLWEIVHCKDIEDFREDAIEQAVDNARFIAASRNVSPAMARVVLQYIAFLEYGNMEFTLATLANQWEGKH